MIIVIIVNLCRVMTGGNVSAPMGEGRCGHHAIMKNFWEQLSEIFMK